MPKQVEDAALEADRLHRELYPEQYEDGDTDNKDSEKKDDADSDDSASDDGNTEDESSKEGEGETTPSESDGTSGERTTDTGVPETKSGEDFQQKYYVLKGKYDAEVPRLHADLSALRTVVGDLQAQLSSKVKEEQPPSDKKNDKPSSEALQFVEKEYPDIYNAMVSLWEQRSTDKPAKRDDEILHRIEAVERVAVTTAEERFFRDLDTEVADWRTHKDDPRFLDWLKKEDELTGYPRLQLAQQAQTALDGKRIAKFYKAFVKEVVGETRKSDADDAGGSKKKGIEKFVAPPAAGGKGAAGKTGDDKNIITTSDIKKFYDDANRGRYRGRDAEFAKMEARIDKAVANGDVVKG